MAYAILKTGGKQYVVEEGQELFIEKLSGQPGDKVEFDNILMTNKDGKIAVAGSKSGTKVKATIVDQLLADKVVIFKYKKRKRYRRKIGHRQPLTKIMVDKISFGRQTKAKAEESAEPEEQT